jgi:hypothetical protein
MLTAVTFTTGARPAWLDECVESVRKQYFDGLHQAIVHSDAGDPGWQLDRWHALHLDEFVAFVDDDDIVMNDALRLCLRALQETSAGIAFTRQCNINANGERVIAPDAWHATRLADVARNPCAIHGLAVIRRSALDSVVIEEARRLGIGIDWLCKAYAAATSGAVHVPITGYGWRRHAGQQTAQPTWQAQFNGRAAEISDVISGWIDGLEDEPIRVWPVEEPLCA